MSRLLVRFGCFGALAWITLIIVNFCAWVHSLIFSFQHLNDKPNEWIVLAVSVIPPVGIIHGWALWLGLVTQ